MSTNADARSAAKENEAMPKSRKTTTTPNDDLARAGVNATAFNFPDEAIVHAEEAQGLLAIECKGRWFTIAKRDARRLLRAKVPFAYLRDREGEVYTVRAK
jgi:hypothetical protein